MDPWCAPSNPRVPIRLAKAERWYRQSLKLYSKEDRLRRARCLAQLGGVAYERFSEARKAAKSEQELHEDLIEALRHCFEALELIPRDAIADLVAVYGQLGNIYGEASDLDRALGNYRKNINYSEAAGNLYGAAQTRFNVALSLAERGRFADAKEYAVAALSGHQTFGDRAKDEVMETLKLIAAIEQGLKAGGEVGAGA